MSNREQARDVNPRQLLRRPRLSLRVVAIAALLLGSLAATALAAGSALTLGSANNSTLSEQVVVNGQGRTLYALHPETTKHLLCKSSECFKHWPPLTVSSSNTKLKDGSGVQGHLAILRRSNGMLQVTLRGLPLYRYSGDHAKGDAAGEGIETFGGKWHAVGATSSSKPAKQSEPSGPAMPAPAPAPSMPAYPTYGY
jgi:predicted lipoprotein with Yx(FWY)xxD motif